MLSHSRPSSAGARLRGLGSPHKRRAAFAASAGVKNAGRHRITDNAAQNRSAIGVNDAGRRSDPPALSFCARDLPDQGGLRYIQLHERSG